jgi:hypothetical protein
MTFLMLLEQVVDQRVREVIRARNRLQARGYELTGELDRRHSALSEGADQPTVPTAYLVIQFEPDPAPGSPDDPDGDDRYILTEFRQWQGAGAWNSHQVRQVRGIRSRDLEREVEQIIEGMEQEWEHRTENVVIEFILPMELLNTDIEWWQSDSASSRSPVIAMDYPVVVRSLERLRRRRWHRAWHRRWRTLRERPAGSEVYWSRPGGAEYLTVLETDLKSDDRWVSLVLSEPPMAGRNGRHEIQAAFRAGLPVIIWHRRDCTNPDFREAVSRLTSDGGLARLPTHAKELRWEALRLGRESSGDHVGWHLTVLWDDPERKPEPFGSLDWQVGSAVDGRS